MQHSHKITHTSDAGCHTEVGNAGKVRAAYESKNSLVENNNVLKGIDNCVDAFLSL